jgi:hypothetical protein
MGISGHNPREYCVKPLYSTNTLKFREKWGYAEIKLAQYSSTKLIYKSKGIWGLMEIISTNLHENPSTKQDLSGWWTNGDLSTPSRRVERETVDGAHAGRWFGKSCVQGKRDGLLEGECPGSGISNHLRATHHLSLSRPWMQPASQAGSAAVFRSVRRTSVRALETGRTGATLCTVVAVARMLRWAMGSPLAGSSQRLQRPGEKRKGETVACQADWLACIHHLDPWMPLHASSWTSAPHTRKSCRGSATRNAW